MSEVRRRVRRHVGANPGVHFNELASDIDIATGQAQYHLRRLLGVDEIDAEDVRGRTHYFPKGYDGVERRAIALLRRETIREIVAHALAEEEPYAAELTDALGVARSTVTWHVSTLVDAGLAEKSYDEDGRMRVRLARPQETSRLLAEVTPGLPETLVDRFSGTADAGLYVDGG